MNTCVSCGSIIPEGIQVCPRCKAGVVIGQRKLTIIATILDVETTDIMVVRDLNTVQCAHYPPPSFADDTDLYQPAELRQLHKEKARKRHEKV